MPETGGDQVVGNDVERIEPADISFTTFIRSDRTDVLKFIYKMKNSRTLYSYLSKLVNEDFERRTNPGNTKEAFLTRKLDEVISDNERMKKDIQFLGSQLERLSEVLSQLPKVTNVADEIENTMSNTKEIIARVGGQGANRGSRGSGGQDSMRRAAQTTVGDDTGGTAGNMSEMNNYFNEDQTE